MYNNGVERRIVGIMLGFVAFLLIVGGIFLLAAKSDKTGPLRKAGVAGAFYPKTKQELARQLGGFLAGAIKAEVKAPFRILVAPHAGLQFSGRTAAYAFKQVEGTNITKVIILGSSHKNLFDHAAVLTTGSWETPLSNLEIDNKLAVKLLNPVLKIVEDAQVHDEDHVLEMQVIWVKQVLPGARIVPIMISKTTPELISNLALKIAQNMDEQTLLVISTDLSHYPNYETANLIDSQTINAILAGEEIKSDPHVETVACGIDALRVAFKVSQLLKLDKPVLLKYENSGDTSAERNRVVGYAAIGYPGEAVRLDSEILSHDAKKEALEIAKTSLGNYVNGKILPGEIIVTNPELLYPLGAFVTLKKDGQLRGCIGEFEPNKPLFQVIADKTVASSSEDPRFRPVTPDELDKITLEISVMTPRQKISDYKKINLGRDGVVIIKDNHSGTFLPQVASESGWDLETFLKELCTQKAGLPANCYQDPKTEIYTYQAQVFE